MLLCGGDGFADIFGRTFGQTKISWNKRKSISGSLAFFFFGYAFSVLMVLRFYQGGWLRETFNPAQFAITMIPVAALTTIVESLPIFEVDNVTVAVSGVILSVGLQYYYY
mmetsp:Transcript_27845/g.38494  ORF Transcript_27845/g.38494 Transcript_27845/m.38494 type:complete len:110 (+) Transcript_27845:91-420(+)